MTKGRIIGGFILAAWVAVHGIFITGYMSKWEKIFSARRWEYFSTGSFQELTAAGFPDFAMKYPRGWMMREGMTEHPREDMEIYFYASPYEEIFTRFTALGKYPYGNPSLQDVNKEALGNLQKQFPHFAAAGEPAFYENTKKQSAILMTEFQCEISRWVAKPVKLHGLLVSYDGLSYGAYSSKRPAYFVAVSREKYFSRAKKIFLDMISSITQ